MMNLPNDIRVYGNTDYRGACPKETLEQVTFFSRLRREYPDTLGVIAFHVRNEGKRTHLQAATEKSEGMTAGAPDILIPGAPAFVCELKRRDHTQSELRPAQLIYLRAAQAAGCFVCVALGVDAAWEALHEYMGR
jgi:alkylhydroperoxidase family enzyme